MNSLTQSAGSRTMLDSKARLQSYDEVIARIHNETQAQS